MKMSLCLLVVSLLSSQLNLDRKIEIPDWENSVRFELVTSQQPVRPGDAFELAVVVEIDPGYHLYGPEEQEPSNTRISLQKSDVLTAAQTVYPDVIRRDLEGLGEYDLYEGRIAIRIPVQASSKLAAGTIDAAVDVEYQVCTDFACSAPNSKVLTVPVRGAKAGAAVKKLHPDVFTSK